MQNYIYQLKRAIFEIEKDKKNTINVIKNLDIIIETCEEIKEMLNKDRERKKTKLNLKSINSIPFMYKPLTREDYFAGDYLERFSEERTRELKEAEALEIHNKFWIQLEPIKGSIFGSVPKELLSSKAINSLIKNNWKEVTVNAYETSINDIKIIIDYCNENFKDYIIVKEKSTSLILILHYETEKFL